MESAQAAGTGAANAWGVMSLDEENGLMLVPTGSASPDFYGGSVSAAIGLRDSLLALTPRATACQAPAANTPRSWDFDVARQPVLETSKCKGSPVPSVHSTRKTGSCMLL